MLKLNCYVTVGQDFFKGYTTRIFYFDLNYMKLSTTVISTKKHGLNFGEKDEKIGILGISL